MKPTDKKHSPNWGGIRPGAGRKNTGGDQAVIVSLSLPKEQVEEVDAIAKKRGESRSSVLRLAVLVFLKKGNKK